MLSAVQTAAVVEKVSGCSTLAITTPATPRPTEALTVMFTSANLTAASSHSIRSASFLTTRVTTCLGKFATVTRYVYGFLRSRNIRPAACCCAVCCRACCACCACSSACYCTCSSARPDTRSNAFPTWSRTICCSASRCSVCKFSVGTAASAFFSSGSSAPCTSWFTADANCCNGSGSISCSTWFDVGGSSSSGCWDIVERRGCGMARS
ncbi:hypothetical protein EDD21DRAFT_93059 [Dissophora ornata]|nr:hypothetical protein EDD21DRAFT_93059 [Dissophora ornata]